MIFVNGFFFVVVCALFLLINIRNIWNVVSRFSIRLLVPDRHKMYCFQMNANIFIENIFRFLVFSKNFPTVNLFMRIIFPSNRHQQKKKKETIIWKQTNKKIVNCKVQQEEQAQQQKNTCNYKFFSRKKIKIKINKRTNRIQSEIKLNLFTLI